MNPFLESTVAVSDASARWGGRSFSGRRAAALQAGAPRSAVRPLAQQAIAGLQRSRAGLRRTSRLFRNVTLAGALLAPAAAAAVDVNIATTQQLQEVKGIGPKMARVIIDERERGGRFASIDDLSERVKGIGPKKAASMQSSGLIVGVAAGNPVAAGSAADTAKAAKGAAGRRAR